MIVAFAGKGGVGKTVLCSLLLDELLRRGAAGPVLAVDADPAMTLHLALGLPEPAATVAEVRETTALDAQTLTGRQTSPARHVLDRLGDCGVVRVQQLRRQPLHYLALGQEQGPGCYCRINRALTTALDQLIHRFRLVVVDNEGGLEHLSRYRLNRIDLLVVVTTPTRAAQVVARRVRQTSQQVKLDIGETWTLFNRVPAHFRWPAQDETDGRTLLVPVTWSLAPLEMWGQPVTELALSDPARVALRPLVERLLCA